MKIIAYLSVLSALGLFTFIFLTFFRNRKTVPVQLYAKALFEENKGDFKAAILQYESALAEENKSKFPNNILLNKIHDKLKVLRTVMSYQSSFHTAPKIWSLPEN